MLQVLDEALLVIQLSDLLLVLGDLSLNVLEITLANSAPSSELALALASSDLALSVRRVDAIPHRDCLQVTISLRPRVRLDVECRLAVSRICLLPARRRCKVLLHLWHALIGHRCLILRRLGLQQL